MDAITRIWYARREFDDSWRGHAAAMRSATLLSLAEGMTPALAAAMRMSKGFDPGFDGTRQVEDLLEELEYLRSSGYLSLHRNCLLGISASFEAFAKTVSAALTYDPSWKTKRQSGGCLEQATDDFDARFRISDKAWRKSRKEFLTNSFEWLTQEESLVRAVDDVFWIRNQIAHNCSRANEARKVACLGENFSAGDELIIDKGRIGVCVNELWRCVEAIARETPSVFS